MIIYYPLLSMLTSRKTEIVDQQIRCSTSTFEILHWRIKKTFLIWISAVIINSAFIQRPTVESITYEIGLAQAPFIWQAQCVLVAHGTRGTAFKSISEMSGNTKTCLRVTCCQHVTLRLTFCKEEDFKTLMVISNEPLGMHFPLSSLKPGKQTHLRT